MADHIHLPRAVKLPRAPTMPQWQLLLALGIDRSRLNYWRRAAGFPRAIRDGRAAHVIVADVVDWCRARGVRTEII